VRTGIIQNKRQEVKEFLVVSARTILNNQDKKRVKNVLLFAEWSIIESEGRQCPQRNDKISNTSVPAGVAPCGRLFKSKNPI
jgi:hypothetical protein